jgi:hypothetical protein
MNKPETQSGGSLEPVCSHDMKRQIGSTTEGAGTILIPLKNPPSLFESFGRRGRLQAD